MLSNKKIYAIYGKHAVISRKGSFVLVHLDRPTRQLVRERTREFDPEVYFCRDCPLCQMLKETGIVVFDDFMLDDSEDEYE